MIQAESYRRKADGIKEKIASLTIEEEKQGKELEQLREENRKTEEDMKQVIRYSHLEVLTQEVVDIFIKRIYVFKGKRVEIQWSYSNHLPHAGYGRININGTFETLARL